MTEVEDLQARFAQAVALFNAGDLATWAAYNHDEVVFFSPHAPFAVEGKVALLQAMQTLLSQNEYINWKIINPQFRVLDATGVTWGHYAFTVKPKDGPVRTEFARFLLTWAKSDGQWRIVAEHNSRIPSGA
jgi:ketosteroid isomerase-like protein